MRNFLVIFCLLLIGSCAFAVDNTISKLSKIENYLFGVEYLNIPRSERIVKIEKEVYGKQKSGNFTDRLNKLTKDLYIDVLGEKDDSNRDAYEEIADDSVDYPVIDNIERELNIKSLKNSDLSSRLACIEDKLFHKLNTSDDFYTRLEKIKNKLGKKLGKDIDYECCDYGELDDYRLTQDVESSKSGFINPYNTYKLTVLEQKLLNDTYPYDNNDRRLARLENYVFSTDFSEDDDKIRISRLEEAIKSMRCKKYDDSKLHRTINAAMQIATMVLMVLAIIL